MVQQPKHPALYRLVILEAGSRGAAPGGSLGVFPKLLSLLSLVRDLEISDSMKNTSINKQEIIFTETNPIGSWLRTVFISLRTNITIPNLIGLIGGLLALFLLLALHEPWDITIPLYLTVLVWTILRPRVALYLMAFAVPWGSLDYIDIRGLRLNSADLLVAFLAIGWFLSFALRRVAPIRGGTGSPEAEVLIRAPQASLKPPQLARVFR